MFALFWLLILMVGFHMDVNNVFLDGDFAEDVYIEPPSDYFTNLDKPVIFMRRFTTLSTFHKHVFCVSTTIHYFGFITRPNDACQLYSLILLGL